MSKKPEIKAILLGNVGVGKTNLINAYFGNPFNTDISMTTTPNQSHSKVDIENNINSNYIFKILI